MSHVRTLTALLTAVALAAAAQPASDHACTPTEVPAFLPLRNVTLVKPTLLDACPDQSDELAGRPTAFWNATLCCSHAASPALASALVAGFYGTCDSLCTFNPGSAALLDLAGEVSGAAPTSAVAGSPLLGWRWDAAARCWQEIAEEAPQACNLTSAAGEAAAERAVLYLQQAAMANFLLAPPLNSSFPGLNATRQEYMGRTGAEPVTEWDALQQLEDGWRDALLAALADDASRDALAAAPPDSPIAGVQAALQETEGEAMCASASELQAKGYSSQPSTSPYAPCLCGNSSEPFLWCYAAYAQELVAEVTDAFDGIMASKQEGTGPSLAAQVLQGEAKPEEEDAEGQGGRRLSATTFKCSSPFSDMATKPSADTFMAFITSAEKTAGKCELCFPLEPPLMACVSLAADTVLALRQAEGALGMGPIAAVQDASRDTCKDDPFAGRSAKDIRAEVEAGAVKLGLQICIDVGAADAASEWGQAVRLMGTKTPQGPADEDYDKKACFGSAGATYTHSTQVLELEIDTGVMEGGGQYTGGSAARLQATIRGTAMMKLAATQGTPACMWAARSRALYEAIACREYCRYEPGVWQRLRIGLVFNVKGVLERPKKVTFINIKARKPPCLQPGCPGQEQAVNPDPGTGCTPTTWQKEHEFYWPSYGELPCSLATTTASGYLAEIRDVPTVEECCQACIKTSGCAAYNYCAEEDGCGVPAVTGGTDGSHCYLYSVDSALSWSKHLTGGGCGGDFQGTWWSGMTRAKTPLNKACPSTAVWRHDEFFMPGATLCSLGTVGDFDGVAFQLNSSAECCAACASTEGCTAWNWCDGNGCFIPGAGAFDVEGQKGDCFLYSGVDYATWRGYLHSRVPPGCGAAGGWWTGHMDAGTPTQPDDAGPFVGRQCRGNDVQPPSQCPPLDYKTCCACRRIKESVAYSPMAGNAGNSSTSILGSEPDCRNRLLGVPGGIYVQYTGAKVFGFDRNGCPPADYARVIVRHGGNSYFGWVPARDVVFCTERKCGTAVELGAACSGNTPCCTLPEEGGHERAACIEAPSSYSSSAKQVTICAVPKLEETAGQGYVISVKTADATGAGTDARILAQLKGEVPPKDSSSWATDVQSEFFLLDNPDKDDFQEGSTSEFKVFAEAMPVVDEVVLKFQRAGWAPSWKPEWVAVRWPNGTSSKFVRQPEYSTETLPNDGWIVEDDEYRFTPPKTG